MEQKDGKLKNDGMFQLIKMVIIMAVIILTVDGAVEIAKTYFKAEASKPAKVCVIVCANDSTSVAHVVDSIGRSN